MEFDNIRLNKGASSACFWNENSSSEDRFEPPIQPTREVIKIIKGKFEGCWESYGEVKRKDEEVTKMWYKSFKTKYKWRPEHEAQIKKSFDHKAFDGLSNAMYRVRRKIDDGGWIPDEMREVLEQKWNNDDWKGKAKINSDNRRSSDGPLHSGGSIPTTEHYKRLKKSSDMTPTHWDLFQRMHKLKGDTSKWVSSKSEEITTKYYRRIAERDSQEETSGEDVSSHQSDNNIYLDVVGGLDKKGRIYGLGLKAGKYKSTSAVSSSGVSESDYEQMRALVSSLTAKNNSFEEQLQTHEERFRTNEQLIRSSQEESRALREQLFRFMETFSLSHASPLPPR